ncbi:MAG: carboxymuconolactone decarboxylase family protein [Myxococcota bacterium]
MTDFTIHSIDSAPEAARPMLEATRRVFGGVPNLYAITAESPQVLEAYQVLQRLSMESGLSAVARNVVWLAASCANNCHYCMAGHSAMAGSQGTPQDVIDDLREGRPLPDPKLEAIRVFATEIVEMRGDISEACTRAFLDSGYTERDILDVLLAVTQKTLSKYVNHFADTPLDRGMEAFAWNHPNKRPTTQGAAR